MPWLAALDRAASWRAALATGLLMAVAFSIAVFLWFADAIAVYAAAPWWMGFGFLAVAAPLLEPQFVTTALARHSARRRGAGALRRTFVTATAWVGTEWCCPKLFGDTLGHGFYASVAMRQAADVAGAAGLTFVLVLANDGMLAAVAARGRPRRALVALGAVGGLAAALLAYGILRIGQLAAIATVEAPITVGVVQANIGRYDRLRAEVGTYEAVRRILDAHLALSAQALARAPLDVLVWPETVYPTTFGTPKSADGEAFDREIGGLVARTGVPLVFGSYDTDGAHEFNAAVFLERGRDGALTFDTYRKAALFPFIERVPTLLESPALRRAMPWLGTWTPGAGAAVVTLTVRDGRAIPVAPLICYDAVDPTAALSSVRRGAEVIVTLSNDSWFDDGAGAHLHFVVSAFRSLETRRPQVRATNTGISAVIAPTGELLAAAGVHERAVLVATVRPVRNVRTLVLAWGDWLGPVALLAALVLLVGPRAGPRAPGARV